MSNVFPRERMVRRLLPDTEHPQPGSSRSSETALIETIDDALEVYFGDQLSAQLKQPCRSACENIHCGFEIRSERDLLAFVRYDGLLMSREQYVAGFPDRG